ncbi:MAG TPA: allophanate hydrolase subunit 1 [Solirubrobacter sp.]|nr:allophanate hydrolase subunit 1 [Solirubrobacter sp.]
MSRYSWGADEHLFVEVAEEMSLQANFKVMAIATMLRECRPDGLLDVCPANASYQVRFDPDVLKPADLEALCVDVEAEVGDAHGFELDTRVVEVPVLYDDPWTNETLMKFRDRHQEPDSTDLEFAARINGFSGKDEFIAAHAGEPWFVSMVGFVAGLPFLYQMVERSRQLEVPKYVRPRTDTPPLTVGHGGCFGCVYSVRGAGGYQMFGITPVPIYDSSAGEVFFKAGDIVKFTGISRSDYDALRESPGELRSASVRFNLVDFEADPEGYNRSLLEALR